MRASCLALLASCLAAAGCASRISVSPRDQEALPHDVAERHHVVDASTDIYGLEEIVGAIYRVPEGGEIDDHLTDENYVGRFVSPRAVIKTTTPPRGTRLERRIEAKAKAASNWGVVSLGLSSSGMDEVILVDVAVAALKARDVEERNLSQVIYPDEDELKQLVKDAGDRVKLAHGDRLYLVKSAVLSNLMARHFTELGEGGELQGTVVNYDGSLYFTEGRFSSSFFVGVKVAPIWIVDAEGGLRGAAVPEQDDLPGLAGGKLGVRLVSLRSGAMTYLSSVKVLLKLNPFGEASGWDRTIGEFRFAGESRELLYIPVELVETYSEDKGGYLLEVAARTDVIDNQNYDPGEPPFDEPVAHVELTSQWVEDVVESAPVDQHEVILDRRTVRVPFGHHPDLVLLMEIFYQRPA